MLLNEAGKPYSEAELNPPKYRTPCVKCGSTKARTVHKGFGGWWQIICSCGYRYQNGRGPMPEEIV